MFYFLTHDDVWKNRKKGSENFNSNIHKLQNYYVNCLSATYIITLAIAECYNGNVGKMSYLYGSTLSLFSNILIRSVLQLIRHIIGNINKFRNLPVINMIYEAKIMLTQSPARLILIIIINNGTIMIFHVFISKYFQYTYSLVFI